MVTNPSITKVHASQDFRQKTSKNLEQTLTEQKEAFADWRYLHEKQNLACDLEVRRDSFFSIHLALCAEYPEIARARP